MPLSPFALCIIAIVAARRARPADRPFDDRGLDPLPAAVRARSRHCRRADPQWAVQQLRAARDPAVHSGRRSHEHRQPHRPPASVLSRAGRPLPRRARARQRRCQHDLRRHVRLGDRGRSRHRPHHHRHDDQGWPLPHRLRGRHHGVRRHHRTDHPSFDPDGALRTDLRHLDRVSVPRRVRSRRHARHRLHGDEFGDRAPPQLSGRAGDPDARNSENHAARISRADAAGDPAVRHLRRRDDADRRRRRCGFLCALRLDRALPRGDVEAALRGDPHQRQGDDLDRHADRGRARVQLRGDDREHSEFAGADDGRARSVRDRLPARRQRHPADPRLPAGRLDHPAGRGADLHPDRESARHRSGALRRRWSSSTS